MANFLSALAGVFKALPKIFEYVDAIIGAWNKYKERKAVVDLEKRQEARRDAQRKLENATTDKEKFDALRRLKRLG